jgi:hypothetical protein
MVEDTVSRILKRMNNALDQGIPLNFYIDKGEFIDMRDVMRDYDFDLQSFYRAYTYSHEDVIFLYINSSDQDDDIISDKITNFLNSIGKTYIYSIDNLKQQWSNMTNNISSKIEKFKIMNDFYQPYRSAEAVVPYINTTLKRAQIEHVTGSLLDGKTIYQLLEISEQIVYIQYGSLIKVHKDKRDIELSYDTKPDHIYIICIIDDIKYEIDIDTSTNTIQYVDIDINRLSIVFGEAFRFNNERYFRVKGSFITQIQNFDDFTFYCFTNGFIRHSPRLIVSEENDLSVQVSEDNLTETKYPVIYMNDFSSPRSLSKSTNKYYLRNFMQKNLTYAMSFQLVNIGVNNYVVNYEIKRQLNVDHAIQFLKTYFNYYEQHALLDGTLQGKLIIESWYGNENPYYTDDIVKSIPSKIANLKLKSQTGDSMFEPEIYSRDMCDCRNQPIIIDKEDKQYWDQYSVNSTNNKPVLFPPTKDDSLNNSKYYVCPTLNKPVLVLKANKGKNNKKYPYLPCCAETVPGAPITEENYFADEGNGPSKTTRQSKYRTPLKQISSNLEKFFDQFGRDFYIYNSKSNSTNSFVGCLLQVHRKNLPNRRSLDQFIRGFNKTIEDTTQDRFIREFRQRCVEMEIVHPCVTKQELYDYDNDSITALIKNGDSSLAYRFFEHLFMINIVILYTEDDTVYVKKPRYTQFHIRNPTQEFPVVFLYYDKERYSVIGREGLYSFNYNIEPLIQPYYLTDSSTLITYQNPYRGVVWEKIFKIFEITGQRIDKNGKTYAINLLINGATVSIYVPPSPPLNVMETTEIGITTSQEIGNFFEGGTIGNGGKWYKINKQEVLFIPCGDIPHEGKVCPHYVVDKSKINKSHKLHVNRLTNCKILIESIEWAWKLSKSNVDDFFTRYVEKVEKDTIFNSFMDLSISSMFPNTNTVNFTRWLCNQNNTFNVIMYGDKINLYDKLFKNVYLHMKHLERTASHSVQQFSITSLYIRSSNTANNLQFNSIEEFKQWQRQDQNLHLLDYLENRPIYIFRNKTGGLFLVKHKETIQSVIDFSNNFLNKTGTEFTIYNSDLEVLQGSGPINIIKYDSGYSTLIPLN